MPSTSFYALSTLSVEKALPRFLEKLYNQGMICVLRTPTPERAAQWSQLLWTYGSGSFLPHGCAPESMEGQPIWITHGPERPEGAETLILVEGATEMDLSPYKRCSYFFDAQSARGVAEAFAYYEQLKNVYAPATLWAQTPQGQWQKEEASSFFRGTV